MATDYDRIAAKYRDAKHHAWRMHIEHYTFFDLLGELHRQSVLDLACGEGFLTRFIKQAGAGRVTGVDNSHEMIRLAREEEARAPLAIEYLAGQAQTVRLPETFDVVTAGYLLNYAQTREQLLEMCHGIARNLKPGGRFVTVNNNPRHELFPGGRKYGFLKSYPGQELREGTPVSWSLFLEDGPIEIVNYHLSIETHEWALRAAGFGDICWHDPRVSPEGVAELGADFWTAFLDEPPIVFLDARKAAT